MVCMIIVINRNFTKIVKREVKSNVLHCLLDLVFARPFELDHTHLNILKHANLHKL